jgi:hypothetical protein
MPVIDLLAADFSSNGQDLRRLVRIVVLSRAYAQDSSPRAAPTWARPTTRPLSVDQLYASITQATGYDGPSDDDTQDGDDHNDEDNDPAGAEQPATAAPAANPKDADANRDDGDEQDDTDRPVEMLGERALTLQRALVLSNGEYVRDASRSGVRVARAAIGRKLGASHLEWAVLATLSRRPSEKERAILTPLLGTPARPNGLEDVLWVLLNSAEFQTNH